VVEAIVNLRRELTERGLDAGPATIAWHLQTHHHVTVSVATIRRRLVAAGLITPEPKKRPRSSYIRFEADLPNELWQSDFTHWRLADGTDVEIIAWLDDHSRYGLSLTCWPHVTGPIVVHTFQQATVEQGFPGAVLTDNGLVYTTRFAGGRGGRNGLETLLAALGIEHRHSRPNHPTTCGKVERLHQTLKRWLAKQPPAETLVELQAHLDAFVDEYNHRRPHSSLRRRPPAVVYALLPKTGPARTTTTGPVRVRHDRVDKTGSVTVRHAGRLHHIGIGRAHARTPIVLIIDGLDIRIVNADTGQLLRHLTLDPNHDYQPLQK
jgi:transposase InsO family protein